MHRAGDTERGREPMGEVRNGKSGILCESICYESIGQRAGGGRCKLPPSSTLPVLREAFLSCLTTGRRQMVEGPSWAAEWRNTRIHKKHTSCRMPTTPHTVQCLQRVGLGLFGKDKLPCPIKLYRPIIKIGISAREHVRGTSEAPLHINLCYLCSDVGGRQAAAVHCVPPGAQPVEAGVG